MKKKIKKEIGPQPTMCDFPTLCDLIKKKKQKKL